MSVDTNENDRDDAQSDEFTRTEKEVEVTLYSYGSAKYSNNRQFIADLFDAPEVLETKETTSEKLIVQLSAELTDPRLNYSHDIQIDETLSPYLRTSEMKAIKEDLGDEDNNVTSEALEEDLPEWLDVRVEETVQEVHEENPETPVNDLLTEILPDNRIEDTEFTSSPLHYSPTYQRSVPDPSYGADEGETVTQRISVERTNTGVSRVKRHQSERTREDRFKDEEPDRWSVSIMVTVEASGEDEQDELTEEIVPTLHDALMGLDGAYCVRISDCSKTVTTEGECFNVL